MKFEDDLRKSLSEPVRDLAQTVALFNLFDLTDERLGRAVVDAARGVGVDPGSAAERVAGVILDAGFTRDDVEEALKAAYPGIGKVVRSVATLIKRLARDPGSAAPEGIDESV